LGTWVQPVATRNHPVNLKMKTNLRYLEWWELRNQTRQ